MTRNFVMLLVALFVALTACGTSATITGVTVAAGKTGLAPNETTTLTATVTGDGSFDASVAWSKVSGEGSLSSSSGASITFTAGAAAGTTVVRATSAADSAKFAEVSLVVGVAGTITVAISSPSADVSTKGTVPIQVAVTGSPDSVDLLRDGEVLVTLQSPYTYSWDTSAEPEKTYAISARGTKSGLAPVTSAPRKIKVDRTGPKIVSQVPAGGDTNAFLASEISATFDEPLAPASVTTTSAKLLAGANPVAATVTLSQDGLEVTFVPTANPSLPATLTMSFTGITDVLGNPTNATSAAFTAPEWQSPGTQPLDVNAAYNAVPWSFVSDANGNLYVAFDEYDDKVNPVNRNVYVKKWNGTTWTQLGGALDVSVGLDASGPSMALDGSGNPVVAWSEGPQLNPMQLYVKKWNGNAWTQLGGAINVAVTGSAGRPALALDASGTPFVSWAEYDTVSFDTSTYVKKWNGSAWVAVGVGPLDLVQTDTTSAPTLQVDGNGLPIVVFYETDGVAGGLVAQKWNGSSWTSLGSPSSSYQSGDPNLALESNGTPVLTWNENGNVVVARWSGSAWVPLGGPLDVNLARPVAYPNLKLTKANLPVVAWAEHDGTSFNVWVKAWTGSAWVALSAAPLDMVQSKNAEPAVIALDAKNLPFVAFGESDGTSVNAYVKRYNQVP